LETRKATVPAKAIANKLAQIAQAHTILDRPDGLGRMVGKK